MSGGTEPRTFAIRNQAECVPMALLLRQSRCRNKTHERLDAADELMDGKEVA